MADPYSDRSRIADALKDSMGVPRPDGSIQSRSFPEAIRRMRKGTKDQMPQDGLGAMAPDYNVPGQVIDPLMMLPQGGRRGI